VGPLGLVKKSSYGFIGGHQGLTNEFQGLGEDKQQKQSMRMQIRKQ